MTAPVRWPGQWSLICDVCGFRFRSRDMQKRWDGLMVCAKDYETRNPQDFVRVHAERINPPVTRPESTDTFTPYTCFVYAQYAYADLAEADCAIADRTTITYRDAYLLKYGTTP